MHIWSILQLDREPRPFERNILITMKKYGGLFSYYLFPSLWYIFTSNNLLGEIVPFISLGMFSQAGEIRWTENIIQQEYYQLCLYMNQSKFQLKLLTFIKVLLSLWTTCLLVYRNTFSLKNETGIILNS